MLGISNLNGQPKLVRPRIELDPLFNLLDYDETRDGFINALECGCDLFQGYYYSKPLILLDLQEYISDISREIP